MWCVVLLYFLLGLTTKNESIERGDFIIQRICKILAIYKCWSMICCVLFLYLFVGATNNESTWLEERLIGQSESQSNVQSCSWEEQLQSLIVHIPNLLMLLCSFSDGFACRDGAMLEVWQWTESRCNNGSNNTEVGDDISYLLHNNTLNSTHNNIDTKLPWFESQSSLQHTWVVFSNRSIESEMLNESQDVSVIETNWQKRSP